MHRPGVVGGGIIQFYFIFAQAFAHEIMNPTHLELYFPPTDLWF